MQGRYDAALQQLDGARTSGSSNADNENVRGLALMLRGEPAKAVAAFDRALELDATLIEPRFNRAVAKLKLGELRDAAMEFGAIASAGEDTRAPKASLRASAAYHQALALDRGGDAAGAEAALERALALDLRFAAAMLYRGLLLERRGALEPAVRSYLDYLRIHPDSTAAMLRVGVVAQRAGRTDVGVAYLRKVIEKDAASPEAVEARKFLVMWE